MNTAKKFAAEGAQLRPLICKAAAGFAPIWRTFQAARCAANAPEKCISFSNDRAVNMRSRCRHQDAAGVSIRCHKRDGGADERPAGATTKSLA